MATDLWVASGPATRDRLPQKDNKSEATSINQSVGLDVNGGQLGQLTGENQAALKKKHASGASRMPI